MNIPPRLLISAAVVAVLQFAPGNLDAQILKYDFNQTGTTAPSTGTTTTSLTLYNTAGAAADLHGAAGSGVSGVASDRAFDNSASSGMGSTGTGGRGQSASSIAAINTLQSFTLTGWFKTDSTTSIGSNACLINNENTSAGFKLFSNATGQLALNVNGSPVTSTGTTAYAATQSWVFFAVTYDGTIASNNVKFYVGNTSTATSLNVTRSLAQGTTVNNTSAFSIGNLAGTNTRPFDGLMDDIAIYGSQTDNTGVLSLAQIEAVRAANVIPEPSTLGLLACGMGLLIGIPLKRRSPKVRH